MSDFDKEAEREKLREKYERDREEREATEKMSELLLQGATMTNAHCSECGDPIFRYDGQEFCATCQRPVDRETADEESDDGDSAGDVEVTQPRDDAHVQFGSDSADAADGADEDLDGSPDRADAPPETTGDGRARETGPGTAAPAAPAASDEQSRPRPSPAHSVPSLDPDRNDDLGAAKASLVRTLARFSKNAEATSDPQEAAEHLAAAREAAEALAALRR